MQKLRAINRPAPLCLRRPANKNREMNTCTCVYCKKMIHEDDESFFEIPPKIRAGKDRQGIHRNCLLDAIKEYSIIIDTHLEINFENALYTARKEYTALRAIDDIGLARHRYLANFVGVISGNPGAILCKINHL